MRRRAREAAFGLALVLCLAVALPASAAADAPKTLWQGCESGSAAGQCLIPRGITADPTTGLLYVVEAGNTRVSVFDPWGQFVKAWGWGVRNDADELQTCTAATGCQAGSPGSGNGQFDNPQGAALDSAGNLYVFDKNNSRVQKFDPGEGEEDVQFLLEFGSAGTGDGQFGPVEFGGFIDVGPGDVVYIGDVGRIQKFTSAGAHIENIPLPGETVQGLAVDSGGNMYVSYFEGIALGGISKEGVDKLDPTGSVLCAADVSNPRALAVDADDVLYVSDQAQTQEAASTMRKFTPACAEVPDYAFSAGLERTTAITTNVVTQTGESALYFANANPFNPFIKSEFVRAYHPPPDRPLPFIQPPEVAPTIADQYAVSVDTDSAVLRGSINPHFWDDTTYYVQYGTAPCFEGGCAERPAAPGTPLAAGVVDEEVTTAGVVLPGLQPNTTYHFRFVAQSGGGAAFGEEGTFRTFPAIPAPRSPDPCPNAALRSGAGAYLPDCRGYELVSPLDKGGGEVAALGSIIAGPIGGRDMPERPPARVAQATPDGEGVSYSATVAFPGALSTPWSSQYVARRGPGGWATEILNAPRGNVSLYGQLGKETPFKALSEDLCDAWFLQDTDFALVEGAPAGVPNLYRRKGCGAEDYELLTSTDPPGPGKRPEGGESFYYPYPQGFSADGERAYIRANAKLTSDASEEDLFQLYEASDGPEGKAQLNLISVLPNGEAAQTHASLGTQEGSATDYRRDNVRSAVSEDGSRVFWTLSDDASPTVGGGGGSVGRGPGELYVRLNPAEPPSEIFEGKCIEPERACTVEIASEPSTFWAATPDGDAVLYQSGEELFEARIEEQAGILVADSTPIATGVEGVIGASEDLGRVYVVSTEDLAPGAQSGESNLYLWEREAGFRLVATLAQIDGPTDANQILSPYNIRPSHRSARVSPDGLHAAFMSRAPLTGFDNADAQSGEPNAEVFLYDATAGEGAGELRCVSCNPSGARPTGRNQGFGDNLFWVAAQIPGWETEFQPSRLLAEDGSHLFFESHEALVTQDTNGATDVYQWSEAASAGECEQVSFAAVHSPEAGGCISLISSGQSPADSELIDASADGRDVFFTTTESLFSEDPGLRDLYDARIGGGFAPKAPLPPCQGESCQPPPAPPADSTPASAAFQGKGNPAPPRRVRVRCPKGERKVRRRGRTRCVKRKRAKSAHTKRGSFG